MSRHMLSDVSTCKLKIPSQIETRECVEPLGMKSSPIRDAKGKLISLWRIRLPVLLMRKSFFDPCQESASEALNAFFGLLRGKFGNPLCEHIGGQGMRDRLTSDIMPIRKFMRSQYCPVGLAVQFRAAFFRTFSCVAG